MFRYVFGDHVSMLSWIIVCGIEEILVGEKYFTRVNWCFFFDGERNPRARSPTFLIIVVLFIEVSWGGFFFHFNI